MKKKYCSWQTMQIITNRSVEILEQTKNLSAAIIVDKDILSSEEDKNITKLVYIMVVFKEISVGNFTGNQNLHEAV